MIAASIIINSRHDADTDTIVDSVRRWCWQLWSDLKFAYVWKSACRHRDATRRIIDLPPHDVGWSAQASACVGYYTNAHKLDVGMSCPKMLIVAGSQALRPDAGLGMPASSALCACARGSIISLGVPGQW